MSSLIHSKAWIALQDHFQQIKDKTMREAFQQDTQRFYRFSVAFNDIVFDYSKNRINNQTLPLLIDLANQAGLQGKINALFLGEKINTTEHRAVLHTALRNRSNQPI